MPINLHNGSIEIRANIFKKIKHAQSCRTMDEVNSIPIDFKNIIALVHLEDKKNMGNSILDFM